MDWNAFTIADRRRFPPPIKTTGSIRFEQEYDKQGVPIRLDAEWIGGDVTAMTYQLLENANPQYLKREGDIVMCCGFKMRVLLDCQELEVVYMERVAND